MLDTPSSKLLKNQWKIVNCPFNIHFAARRIIHIFLPAWHNNQYFLTNPIHKDDLQDIIDNLPAKDSIFVQSTLISDIPRFSFKSGKFICKYRVYPRYVLDLEKEPEFLMQNLSTKSRSTLKRKIKNLEKLSDGSLDVFSPQTCQEMEGFLERVSAISANTYQHKLFQGGIPDNEDFKPSILEEYQKGNVRGWILRIDGQDAAYLLCPAEGEVIYYEYVGYNPDYKDYSVGIVLQWFVLSELMKEKKFKIFDFTSGGGQHKAQFSSGGYECSDIFISPILSKATVLVFIFKLCNDFDNFCTLIAKRLGIKNTLKKILRSLYLRR